jgi:hypothetical protein
MIPNIAVICIQTPRRHLPGLWLPLFLLWIPALLLAPFVLLILLVVCLVFRVSFLRSVAAFWAVLCSLPGTNVRVCADGSKVQVRIL